MFNIAFINEGCFVEVTLRWNYYLILTKKVSNEIVKSISNYSLGGLPVAVEQGNILLKVGCLVWVR